MDHFGRSIKRNSRGARGFQGLPGKNGTDATFDDYCQFLPKTMIRQFKQESSYFSNNKNSYSLKNDHLMEWSSSNSLVKLYGKIPAFVKDDIIQFANSLYVNDDIDLFDLTASSGWLAITFQTNASQDQCLISNVDDYQKFQINVSKDHIEIIGKFTDQSSRIIHHNCSINTTLFIHYTLSSPSIKLEVSINKDKPVIYLLKLPTIIESGCLIANSSSQFKPFFGHIWNFSLYSTISKKEIPQVILQTIKSTLIDDTVTNLTW